MRYPINSLQSEKLSREVAVRPHRFMMVARSVALAVLFASAHPARANTELQGILSVWISEVASRLHDAVHAKSKTRSYTYQDLAADLRISKAAVSKYRTLQHPLNIDVGRAAAEALDVRVEWLMAFDVLQRYFHAATEDELRQIDRAGRGRILRTVRFALESDPQPGASKYPTCEAELDGFLDGLPLNRLTRAINRRGRFVIEVPKDQDVE